MTYTITFTIKGNILNRFNGDYMEIGLNIEQTIFVIFGFYPSSFEYEEDDDQDVKIILTFIDEDGIFLTKKDEILQLLNLYGDNVEFTD